MTGGAVLSWSEVNRRMMTAGKVLGLSGAAREHMINMIRRIMMVASAGPYLKLRWV